MASKGYPGHWRTTRAAADTGMTTVGLRFGIYGAAANVGWELGRIITNTRSYQNIVHPKIGGEDGLISTRK